MTVRHVADILDIAIQDHERSARFHQQAAARLRTHRQKLIDDADRHLVEIKGKAPKNHQKEKTRG
jgi:hypothetical protein